MQFVAAADPRLSYYSPQPVDRSATSVRLERFPRSAYEAVKGQIGPLANLRSSSGCAVVFRTDSPAVVLHVEDLRHHQLVPVGVACEVEGEDDEYAIYASPDLRELARSVEVRFATGLEREDAPRTVSLWLPLISTCSVGGISVMDGSQLEAAVVPEPRWLAMGDSLTQGFSVQCPTQNWVHRLARRWKLPAWNLGVGGLRIEPGVFEWALRLRSWDLVTIGLGSNHSWRDVDADRVANAAAELAELVMAGGHRRVVWLLPPYKPCEEGKGPGEFAGVPLTQETGERVRRVRESLRARLCEFEPGLEVVDDLLPHDARYYPDGLHPFAAGFARMAENLARAIEPVEI